jgi:hypothetical protein
MVKNIGRTQVGMGLVAGIGVLFFSAFLSNARAFVQESGTSSVKDDFSQYSYPYPPENEGSGLAIPSTGGTTGDPSPWVRETDSSGSSVPGGSAKIADKIPPTPPTNLLAGQADGQNAVLLWWSASRDASGVRKYLVYRNGVKLAESVTTKYLDTSVSIGGQYIYFIVAQDAAGNISERSKASALSFPVVTTKAVSTVPSGEEGRMTEGVSGGADVNSGGTSVVVTPVPGGNPDQPTQGGGTRYDDGGMVHPGSGTGSSATVTVHDDTNKTSVLVASGSSSVPGTLLGSVVVKNGAPGSWIQETVKGGKGVSSQKSGSSVSVPVPSTGSTADQDGDGLSDVEEARRGTDSNRGDTDGDGFSDGDEVRSGYNPLKYSVDNTGDRVVFQSPKETQEKQGGITEQSPPADPMTRTAGYQVQKVERVNYEGGKQMVQLSGTATPNSFVTVYLYSDPVIAIVETDASGNWTYGFDSQLEDGGHEAYVAATDNEGRIMAQSKPFLFVKTAGAIAVSTVPKNVPIETPQSSEEEVFSVDKTITVGIIIMTILSLGGIIIWHFVRRARKVVV